jgi:hypothetical protein
MSRAIRATHGDLGLSRAIRAIPAEVRAEPRHPCEAGGRPGMSRAIRTFPAGVWA